MPFTDLASLTRASLLKLAESVADVHPMETRSFRFRTGSLDPAVKPTSLIDEVGAWSKGAKVLYTFRTDAPIDELDLLLSVCEDAKERKVGARKYARIFTSSQTLYVGGSQSMKSRFAQHLGFGPKDTYAMHLAHWAREPDVEVELVVARYDPNLDDEVLGALEDALWSQCRPMFGRQGRR